MMEDARLFNRRDDYLKLALEEVQYLDNLQVTTWEFLAGAAGYSAEELRSDVLEAAHTSISFMQFRLFDAMLELPFCLMIGDVSRNIDHLKSRT